MSSTSGLTAKIQIKHRWTGAVLFEGRFGSLRLCVEAAAKAGANLARANLAGANLAGANLARANLADANLARANLARAKLRLKDGTEVALTGPRPIMQIGPLGSRAAPLSIYRTEAGLIAQTGCFGPAPLAEFETAVSATHGDNQHAQAYRAAVALARVAMEAAR